MLYNIAIQKAFKHYFIFGGILIALLLAIFMTVPSFADSLSDGSVQSGVDTARGNDVPTTLTGDSGIVSTAINAMLYIVGILSVIMLIFGGIRYVVSGGNSNAVTSAKNTILYSIVGLLVSLFAYAIVNFVLDSLLDGMGSGGTNV